MNIAEELKTKYFKIHEVTDLKDLIYKSAERYGNKAAFEIKNKEGKIIKISYNKLKEDVISLRY